MVDSDIRLFGIEVTDKSNSLTFVVAIPISNTVPSMSGVLIHSPRRNCPSRRIFIPPKILAMESCAPKPTAIPRIPNPPNSGTTLMPHCDRMIMKPTIMIAILNALIMRSVNSSANNVSELWVILESCTLYQSGGSEK